MVGSDIWRNGEDSQPQNVEYQLSRFESRPCQAKQFGQQASASEQGRVLEQGAGLKESSSKQSNFPWVGEGQRALSVRKRNRVSSKYFYIIVHYNLHFKFILFRFMHTTFHFMTFMTQNNTGNFHDTQYQAIYGCKLK